MVAEIQYKRQEEVPIMHKRAGNLLDKDYNELSIIKGNLVMERGVKIMHTRNEHLVGKLNNSYHVESAKRFFTTFDEALLSRVLNRKQELNLI